MELIDGNNERECGRFSSMT